MDIKDFYYGWRFTDKDYALFSEKELSQIKVLSSEEACNIWYSYCDEKLLPKSYFVNDIVTHTLPILTGDCGWGDEEAESETKLLLAKELRNYIDGFISVCYDSDSSLRVSTKLFCDKWSDFCYPSDYLIIDCGDRALLYYEDLIYCLNKLEKT